MGDPKRFRPDSVKPAEHFHNPIEADSFRPLPGTDRDKFGNRFVSSGILGNPEKGYMDKDHPNARAGFLISPEGQRLIKANPGLLSQIDGALVLCDDGEVGKSSKKISEILSVAALDQGGQSKLYKFFINGSTYVGKTQTQQEISVYYNNQSYVTEMLQIQTLAAEKAKQLEQINVALPEIYFATSQFMLREFIRGKELDSQATARIESPLIELLGEFLRQKRRQDSRLWSGVKSDLNYSGQDFKTNNFIQEESGRVVMIDPFAYYNLKAKNSRGEFLG